MIVTDTVKTAEDLIKLGEGRYELEEGVIKEMAPAGEEHGVIAAGIIYRLTKFVKENKLGVTTTSETGYKLSSDPDTVKAPDAAYKSNKRLSEGGITKGYSGVMPELVVEVTSPSDSSGEILKKVNMWLKAGVLEVWIVDCRSKKIIIYRSGGESKILEENDELEGGAILPGFRYSVKEIFEYGV